jgi:ABC-type oligopeptide transport system ATPase subunit
MMDALVAIDGLSKHFPVGRGWGTARVVKAVDDVSFTVGRKRIVGLVGESGSGKTTVGRSLLRLIEPSAGKVVFDGVDLLALDRRALPSTCAATPTSSPAGSASASGLRARLRSSRNSSSPTNASRRSTSRSKPRC